jgi:hypothetical protein
MGMGQVRPDPPPHLPDFVKEIEILKRSITNLYTKNWSI